VRALPFLTNVLTALLWAGIAVAQLAADDPLALRLSEVASSFTANAQPYGPIHSQQLAQSTSDYIDVQVRIGECYSFVGVGDGSLTDLDLHVYGDGIEVGGDTGIDNTPVVHWCNHLFERVSVELRPYSGWGRSLFQVFVHDAEAELPGHPLRAALNAVAGRYAGGYVAAAPSQLDELPTGGEAAFQLTLAGGRCFVIVAVGADTVTDLDLLLYDGAGALVDSDQATDAEPVVRPCIEAGSGGEYRLVSRMVAGFGEYGFRVFADERDATEN
jgi:hypothetical protein